MTIFTETLAPLHYGSVEGYYEPEDLDEIKIHLANLTSNNSQYDTVFV